MCFSTSMPSCSGMTTSSSTMSNSPVTSRSSASRPLAAVRRRKRFFRSTVGEHLAIEPLVVDDEDRSARTASASLADRGVEAAVGRSDGHRLTSRFWASFMCTHSGRCARRTREGRLPAASAQGRSGRSGCGADGPVKISFGFRLPGVRSAGQ